MKYIPYDYQEYALDFILNQKAAGIFLDCGLGKTVITLTAIVELMHNRFEIPALVIAPLRVAENVWDTEVKKWDHQNTFVFQSAGFKEEHISSYYRRHLRHK